MKTSSQEKPVTAFVLALTGGTLMLISGVISSLWFMYGGLSMDGMMGGFFIGAILGIIGGAIALSWRTSPTRTEK